jgi:hypothetical protein
MNIDSSYQHTPAFLQALSTAWEENFGAMKPSNDVLQALMSMKEKLDHRRS